MTENQVSIWELMGIIVKKKHPTLMVIIKNIKINKLYKHYGFIGNGFVLFKKIILCIYFTQQSKF